MYIYKLQVSNVSVYIGLVPFYSFSQMEYYFFKNFSLAFFFGFLCREKERKIGPWSDNGKQLLGGSDFF